MSNVINCFLIAFGVIVGAGIFSGAAALINGQPPFKTMVGLTSSIKIWAVAVALGGTFSSFEIIEKGLFKGEIKSILKQAIYVLMALLGANAGCGFIRLMQRCGNLWGE